MTYITKWSLFDHKHNVIQNFERICFSNHLNTAFTIKTSDPWEPNNAKDPSRKPGTPHYFQYLFDNAKVSSEEMTQYFKFIRATPEFTHLMPRSIKNMVETKTYTANLTRVNGLQLFTILTVLRAVVEEPKVVRSVIQFDHRRQHVLSHLGILKAAGQQSENFHHWITGSVRYDNLKYGINEDSLHLWDDPTPALKTGLIDKIHDTFQHDGDGYYTDNPVPKNWANRLLEAQPRKPRIALAGIKRPKPRETRAPIIVPLPVPAPW